MSLERPPGEPIFESRIACRVYGVSRTPVREAVLKLADEGLIEIFPQSGTFAARIPLAALPEAIVIRKALEETSARFAAERASRSQGRRDLGDPGAPARGQDAPATARRSIWPTRLFTPRSPRRADIPGSGRLVQQVKVHVDRYRRLTLPQRGRMARVIAEHARFWRGSRPATPPAPPLRWRRISTVWPPIFPTSAGSIRTTSWRPNRLSSSIWPA